MADLNSLHERTLQRMPSESRKILNDSEWQYRHDILGQILVAYREAMQFNQPDDEEGEALEFRVAAWIPLTLCIPAERLFDCYIWAMQNRRSDFPLSAPDLVKAWRGIQDSSETQSAAAGGKYKMLSQFAPGACERCFGTGMEIMPDGSVRPNCQHQPLTGEDRELAREAQAEVAKFMREALKNIGKPKPPATPKKDERGTRLVCGSCQRKVWTVFGFEVGGRCGELLNRGTHDGELKLCEGAFEAAQ